MQVNLNETNLFNAIERSLAMIIFDTSGKIMWANDQFLQIVGYSLEELTSMHHKQLCLDEFRKSQSYEKFWDNLRKNKAYHDKVQRVNKSKHILFLDAIYTPVLAENGQIESVIKIATDVTEQETMIRKSSEEFMALVEEMTAHTNEVYEAFSQITNEIEHLKTETTAMEENVEQIEKMAESVKNIATRSNILGLNANIEAARAGEHGRGFSVVANEIRKMSETSKLSAEDISEQIFQIKEYVLLMKKMVDQVTKNIHGNSESIDVLRDAYEQILETAERLSQD